MRNVVSTELAPFESERHRRMGNPLWADIVIYTLLILSAIVTLLPMVAVIARSLSPGYVIARRPILLIPRDLTPEAYVYIFQTRTLTRSLMVTVFVTVVGTALNLLVTIPGAYGLSKTHVPGTKVFMGILVISMLLSAGIIPTYILVNRLGLINTVWALIIPALVSPFSVILMRNYFWSIPDELEDSAHIDGAGDLTLLVRIVVPLSTPAIATIGLFYAVGHWNNFFRALFYITDNTKWPLQLILRSIVINNNFQNMGVVDTGERRFVSPENIKAATIVFATVPILLVYPFLQKYFVKGIMIGAVKG
jgi:putative aldouronate transport system permease protein